MACKRCFKWYIVTLLLLKAVLLPAQDIASLGKQKPFAITGSVGGGVTFYHSNESFQTQDPFTWNLYGSFNPTFYGFAMPLSFVINQYSRSYATPFAQFGISPTYKWIRLHLGYRTISMSPFAFDGQSFKGAGIELTPGRLRFAAFYGSLNKAINEDTTTGRLAMPQYGRMGYGIKLGVGTAANHIDFVYFHAKDDSSSITLINESQVVRPEENTVIGTSFKFTFFKRVILTADAATSALSQDLASAPVNPDTLNNLQKILAKAFVYRNSTVLSYAGQSLLTVLLNSFTATVGYRRVQPDFQSLGTPYMLSDIEAWQGNANLSLAKGRVNINASVNTQHNDLDQDLVSELHNSTEVFNISALISRHFNLNISASNVKLNQTDGTGPVSDSIRENEQIYAISVMPSIIFSGKSTSQTITPSFNYSAVNDLNSFTAPTGSSNTLSATVSYVCTFLQRHWSLNGNILYNNYTQGAGNEYVSYGLNAGGAVQLLKEKNLGIQLSLGYLFNNFTEGSGASSNVTGSFSTRYTYKKHHSFSLYTNYVVTPPNSLQQKLLYGVSTNNLAGGMNYSYSF